MQCTAAMRLLYYFPKETAPLLAARLHSLQVQNTGPSVGSQSTDKEMARWEKRELANGVRTDEFVKAVSWCPDPLIQKEMADIVMRTGDPDVMAAAVRGIPPSEHKRLTPSIQKRLHAESPSKSAWHYESYLILKALAHYWGEEALSIFEEYLLQKDPIHLYTVCAALRSDGTEWNRSLLLPLLADKRPIPDLGHWITPKGGGRQILTRVCDAAAQALTTGHSDMDFDMDQPTPLLDRQIAVIQRQFKH